jgi:hypothetical protein
MRAEEKRALLDEQAELQSRQARIRDDYARALVRQDDLNKAIPGLEQAVVAAQAQVKDAVMRLAITAELLVRGEEQDEEVRSALTLVNDKLGRVDPNTGKAPAPQTKVMEAAERFGQFTAADLAYVLKMTPQATTVAIREQIKAGTIRETGSKVMGKAMYQHIATVKAQEQEVSQAFHDIRDWVVKQKDVQFTPMQITAATEVEGPELVDALQELIRMGAVEYVGFDDHELYQYVVPDKMGSAAAKDNARRKALGRVESTRSTPVAGTGNKGTAARQIGDPDVRALVQQVEAAGGTWSKSTTGSGHIEVFGEDGRSVLISSTPSSRRSVLNDRSRVRRVLKLKV